MAGVQTVSQLIDEKILLGPLPKRPYMENVTATPAAEVTRRRRSDKFFLGLFLVIMGVFTGVNYFDNQSSAQNTLQKILDEQATVKSLHVQSIYLPLWSSIPMYANLASMGLLPRKVAGSFQITSKDRTLSENCRIDEFDFAKVFTSSERWVASISGMEIFKLTRCATGG